MLCKIRPSMFYEYLYYDEYEISDLLKSCYVKLLEKSY